MKGLKYLLLLGFFGCIPQVVWTQVSNYEEDVIPNESFKNADIYLVIGQSNMAGRAEIGNEQKELIDNAFLFTGNDENPWVLANNPLNRYSSTRKTIKMQRLSPAFSFTKSMVQNHENQKIGLVMNAKGGTKIVQWLPGSELYEEAVKRTHLALKYGTLKGIIWHQGESDSDAIRRELYLGRIEILINALREEFKIPNLPFVAGQVFEKEGRKAFNDLLLQLPRFIKNTAVVSSEGVTTFDGTHFDTKSALMMGNRYAEEMIRLQKK